MDEDLLGRVLSFFEIKLDVNYSFFSVGFRLSGIMLIYGKVQLLGERMNLFFSDI